MNIWKIMYLNCGERYEDMIDHRMQLCTAHNLIISSCEIKAWKKFGPERASNRVQAWFFQALVTQLLIIKLCAVHKCDDQSCLHIFLRSSNIRSFIYSFVRFCLIYNTCFLISVSTIDQLRYTKIQPKTTNLCTRLWSIATEFVGLLCKSEF